MKKICEQCGKGYEIKDRTREYMQNRKYCSHKCRGAANKGTESPNRFRVHKPIIDRLLSKAIRTSEEGCWLWVGVKNKDGYGYIRGSHRLPITLAHRASYQVFKGEIPDGYCVCHTCDNPSCINPNHLWIGTKAENNKDKVNKGRAHWQRNGINS